jgi:FtsX-like permease family
VEHEEEALGLFWKLVLAGMQHMRVRAALSGITIAISIIPVLVMAGIGSHRSVAAHSSDSAVMRIAPSHEASLPSLQPFVSVFLIAGNAITFLPIWANVRHRKHEIGLLTSFGASRTFVFAIVFTEAIVIGLAGAFIAILISQSVLTWLNLLSTATPSYSIGFTSCLGGSCIVIGPAITGAIIPFVELVQRDVIDMLERD